MGFNWDNISAVDWVQKSKKEWDEISYGNYEPSKRDIALHERLGQYYKDTPDSMSNKSARHYYREFRKWCFDYGYTRDEINRAKRNHRP